MGRTFFRRVNRIKRTVLVGGAIGNKSVQTTGINKQAQSLWKKELFGDAITKIHNALGLSIYHTAPDVANLSQLVPVINYNKNVVINHPELVNAGREYARRVVVAFNVLSQTQSRRAKMAMDKMPAGNVKKIFGSRFVEPLRRDIFERILGEKITDNKFKEILGHPSSLLSGDAFNILIAFGEKKDLPRLKQIMEDPLLYHWHGYAQTAIDVISKRR